MKWFIYGLAVLVLILHQDFWNFHSATLVWGWLPMGLAYHAAYSIACSVLMMMLIAVAWPEHLEKLETLDRPGERFSGGH